MAVPLGGSLTRSGFYFPSGPAVAPHVRAAELAAASWFPVVDGATVVHVHARGGALYAGGGELTPARFGDEVIAALGLPPGQPLILVGCQTRGRAWRPGRPGAGAGPAGWPAGDRRDRCDVHHPRRGGHRRARRVRRRRLTRSWTLGAPGDWVIAWPGGQAADGLGPDLLAALAGGRLAGLLDGVAVRPASPPVPLAAAVLWAPSAAGLTGAQQAYLAGAGLAVAPGGAGSGDIYAAAAAAIPHLRLRDHIVWAAQQAGVTVSASAVDEIGSLLRLAAPRRPSRAGAEEDSQARLEEVTGPQLRELVTWLASRGGGGPGAAAAGASDAAVISGVLGVPLRVLTGAGAVTRHDPPARGPAAAACTIVAAGPGYLATVPARPRGRPAPPRRLPRPRRARRPKRARRPRWARDRSRGSGRAPGGPRSCRGGTPRRARRMPPPWPSAVT